MKRLWMRLGLLAGILATGGAGALVANRDPDETPKEPPVVATPQEPNEPRTTPQPITFAGTGGNADSLPAPGAVIRANDNESEYEGGALVRPAAEFENLSNAMREEPTQLSVGDLPTSAYGGQPRYSDPSNDAAESSPAAAGYTNGYADGAAAESDVAPVVERPTSAESYSNELQQVPPHAGTESGGYEVSAYGTGTGSPRDGDVLVPPPLSEAVEMPRTEYGAAAANRYAASSNAAAPAVTTEAPVTNEPPYALQNSAVSPQPSVAAIASTVTLPMASTLASSQPGERQLDGIQTPTLTVEKKAPSEISVGQETTFEIIIRNVGNVAARGVVVTDRVPDGTELVNASPEFGQTNDGALAWALGDIEPGDRATITIDLMPLKEGEIGSVAQLSFQTQASVRTISTKPGLVVEHDGPEKVLKGEDVIFNITLRNPGSGVTTGIVIEEDVPEGLAHLAGSALEYEVGTLRPGEEKKLQLMLKADKASIVKNILRARADTGLQASDEITLEVVAPDLQVAIGGPKTRYLERQVTYEIAVANPGTATAYDVGLVTILPRGLKFVSADNKGNYDSRNHSVRWSLAELQTQDSGSVKLTALPIETGEQKLRLEGTGNLGLQAEYEHTTTVQALAELAFSVQDTQDPIEVNAEATYEVRVVNNSNKAATNIQLAAVFPAGLTPLRGDGPTKVAIEGQQVIMALIDKIGGRDEVVYRIAAKGIGAGDHIIAVQIVSDEVPTPVVKQESTKVYADQ